MKLRKPAAILAAVLSVALLFTGCGKMTPTKLAVKTTAAMVSNPLTGVKIAADADLSMDALGVSAEIGVDLTMDTKFSQDPYRVFMETTVGMTFLGMDFTERSQSYSRLENGNNVTYTHQDSADTWVRQEVEQPDDATQNIQKDLLELMKKKATTDMVLAEETQTLDGREVYVLSCTFTGEEIRSLVDEIAQLEEMLQETDLSTVTVPVMCYIDTKTFLPAKMEMDFLGLNEAIMDTLIDSMDQDLDFLKMDLNIKSIKAVYTDFCYEPIEVPEVPQEALDN